MIPLQTIRVLYLASEAVPFVKVGGLGDVAGSLPVALKSLNSFSEPISEFASVEAGEAIDIRLAIPFHGQIQEKNLNPHPLMEFSIPYENGSVSAVIYETEIQNLPVYLIGGSPFPPGNPVYLNDNLRDGYRYTFFSLAALELARRLDWRPDIIHANDWHTSPAVYALQLGRSQDPFFQHTASVLTIHNLSYLGIGAGPALQGFGLPPAVGSSLPWWAQDAPMPLGLLAADQLVAVSPSYALEILTPEFGVGLHEFLQTRAEVLFGILNGIDTNCWNPRTDPDLIANFGPDNLISRNKDRAILRGEFKFSEDYDIPILGLVSRFDPQKGIDIALEALRLLAQEPAAGAWQAVLLGTGAPELEASAHRLEADFPDRVKVVLRFDAPLAERIYAGADMLLLPSRFEPCGLTQMIAMHYGCVPVAHATGGLKDTILDDDQPGPATGFLFEDATAGDLADAVRRALAVYPDRQHWQTLQTNGMEMDFSWTKSAREYLGVYKYCLSKFSSYSQARD